MRAADRILDLGPGAGENGGKVIAEGTYDEILHNSRVADRALSFGRLADSVAPTAEKAGHAADQDSRGAGEHLRGVDINILLDVGCDYGRFRVGQVDVAPSGAVSGPGGRPRDSRTTVRQRRYLSEIEGDQFIDEVVLVDQSQLGARRARIR